MSYPYKAPCTESSSFGNWSTLAQASSFDQTLPLRMQDNFPSLVPDHMATYTGMDHPASSLSSSCSTSFASISYTDFQGHMNDGRNNLHNEDPNQPMWSYQYAMEEPITGLTMAPAESLLGDPFVQVNSSNHDVEMSAYDDVGIPLVSSPQEVIVKHETDETSDGERQIRRSIFVSRTGGKTVKKEERSPDERARDERRKARKAKSPPSFPIECSGIDFTLKDMSDIERIPGTRKVRRKNGGRVEMKHFCQFLVDGKPCGAGFRRPEHLHRHQRKHSGVKPFICQFCNKAFERKDNCWAHYWTHVRLPGKKGGRNVRKSLRDVLTLITDPKHIAKLHKKWKDDVGYDYDPEREPQEEEDEADDDIPSPAVLDRYTPSPELKHEDRVIRCKL